MIKNIHKNKEEKTIWKSKHNKIQEIKQHGICYNVEYLFCIVPFIKKLICQSKISRPSYALLKKEKKSHKTETKFIRILEKGVHKETAVK